MLFNTIQKANSAITIQNRPASSLTAAAVRLHGNTAEPLFDVVDVRVPDAVYLNGRHPFFYEAHHGRRGNAESCRDLLDAF